MRQCADDRSCYCENDDLYCSEPNACNRRRTDDRYTRRERLKGDRLLRKVEHYACAYDAVCSEVPKNDATAFEGVRKPMQTASVASVTSSAPLSYLQTPLPPDSDAQTAAYVLSRKS